MKPKNKILGFGVSMALSIGLLLPPKAEAICNVNPAQIAETMFSMCWECIFPISIAGIPVIQGHMPDPLGTVSTPICLCPAPPPLFIRIGIPIGYWEPSRSIDITKDAYCFAGMGINMGISSTQRGTKGNAESLSRTFFHSHYYIYPVLELIGIFVDTMSLRGVQGLDIAYMTEVDHLWNDDQ